MRERAKAATPGPWLGVTGMFKDGEWPCVITAQGDPKDAQTWLMGAGNGGSAREANVAHAGSWHPLVALALAEWLEAEAISYDELERTPYGTEGAAFVAGDFGGDVDPALKLARLYLGEEVA
jgi:hypothetical protein